MFRAGDVRFLSKGPIKHCRQNMLSTLFALPGVLLFLRGSDRIKGLPLFSVRLFLFLCSVYRTTTGGYPTYPLSGLPDLIKKIVDEDNKTPLLIDNSEDEKVTAFLSYKAWPPRVYGREEQRTQQ